ncbi:bifunctional DNA primase/polymerase [Variovorax sp. GT1P44]
MTPINQRQSMKAHALAYARLGWHVLPLVPGGKQPFSRLVPNGFHNATRDPETIEAWWSGEPNAGIGIALKASGLVAVDVDLRHDGFTTLDDLQAVHGKLESDVLQITGDGGWHMVFSSQLVESLPGTLGRGIDLKADGYICAEPSIHPNGKTYEWEASCNPLDGCIPSTLPGWIRDMSRTPVPAVPVTDSPMAPTPRWLDCLAALPAIPANERETWLQVGMAIHNERPDAEGFRAWSDWSATSPKFDAQDQSRVWLSFKRRGLSGTTLNTIFAMAQREGWRNVGTITLLPPAVLSGDEEIVKTLTQLEARAAAVRWQVKHAIEQNALGMIFGASGTFKSFIALDLCLHIAHGQPWLGKKTRQGKVVYVAAEGGTGLWRRVSAWHKRRGVAFPHESFFVCDRPIVMNDPKSVEALRASIERVCPGPALVVIDTLSQTFHGNENSNDEIAAFFRSIKLSIMDPLQCGALVVHHSGHSATERPRGASAILANVDYLFGVFRDPTAMLATMECQKQKEGDKLDLMPFMLDIEQLGHDEDNELITSLVATHADTSGDTLLKAVEQRADSHFARLVRAVREFADKEIVRKEFYREMGDANSDTKRKAFKRALEEAIKTNVIGEGAGGHLFLVSEVAKETE